MRRVTLLLGIFAVSLTACGTSDPHKPVPGEVSDNPEPEPETDAPVFVPEAQLGAPIQGLSTELVESYWRGAELADQPFTTDNGLGPTFNADSCEGCHQFPAVGGSSPRYRDFFLVKEERWDGALEDAGTNGMSPVRNIYSIHGGHVPEPEGAVTWARRNAPPTFGVGLFAFIDDMDILRNEDPEDADGDGISGRANWEQGKVGRFGVKAQASSMESFNRGAIFNQMGITTNPLMYDIPGAPGTESEDSTTTMRTTPGLLLPWLLLNPIAKAQVSAPNEPTTDDDGVPDPELSDQAQLDLLIFSTFVAAPEATPLDALAEQGASLFDDMGCASCHIPRMPSTLGPLRIYSDLLLHDMGEARSDGIGAGLATGSEFRTQPLWGVAMHGPFLHDGAADTLFEAIALHGGEGASARDAFLQADAAEQDAVVAFLECLGGHDPAGSHFTSFGDTTPGVGENGGPEAGLTEAEQALFDAGRRQFDHNIIETDGLGTFFNADSCRACHQDPVIGGAGGIDTNVIRYGAWEDGEFIAFDQPILHRSVLAGELPRRMPHEATVVELRQPPSLLGLGRIDGIDDSVVIANADPEDTDGDGISGRVRILPDGRLGRYGWKAQIPTLEDFAADALLVEAGVTVDPAYTDFSAADDGDASPDPELDQATWDELSFYLHKLGPPVAEPVDGIDLAAGAQLFADVGCASCHLPSLGGVAAYTDLLLHEVYEDIEQHVDQEEGVSPLEYRTPPLWGIKDTAPYLHDGSAPTLDAAIRRGHAGEAQASRNAYELLSVEERDLLVDWLRSL